MMSAKYFEYYTITLRGAVFFVDTLYIKLTCRPTWFKIIILICCVCVIVRF